jgi:phosphoglycolate phosphatase-like HAD superfamily hydrolase
VAATSTGGVVTAIAVDLDRCLGDTRPLWNDWLASAGRVLGVDVATLSHDRAEAASALDAAGAGNWRVLLARFAEERAPVYLRPDAQASAALRRLAASGVRLGVFTDAPEELARVALAQTGAGRRVELVCAGANARDRLLASLGEPTRIVETRADLVGTAG